MNLFFSLCTLSSVTCSCKDVGLQWDDSSFQLLNSSFWRTNVVLLAVRIIWRNVTMDTPPFLWFSPSESRATYNSNLHSERFQGAKLKKTKHDCCTVTIETCCTLDNCFTSCWVCQARKKADAIPHYRHLFQSRWYVCLLTINLYHKLFILHHNVICLRSWAHCNDIIEQKLKCSCFCHSDATVTKNTNQCLSWGH